VNRIVASLTTLAQLDIPALPPFEIVE